MSVHARMVSGQLPLNLFHLLNLPNGRAQPDHVLPAFLQVSADLAGALAAAVEHLARSQFAQARALLCRIVEARPCRIEARLLLAATNEQLALHAHAAEQIETAVKLLQKCAPAVRTNWPIDRLLCALGFALERAGCWRHAARRYRQLLKGHPTNLFASYRLAAINLAHDQPAQAVDDLYAILKLRPTDHVARVCLGHLLQNQGEVRQALWEYEQALSCGSDDWAVPLQVVHQMHQAEGDGQFARLLGQLLEYLPGCPELYVRLGNLYSMQGEDELATDNFRQAATLRPDHLDCQLAWARHEWRMGRRHHAAGHLREALAINGRMVEASAGLAVAQYRTRQRGRSQQSLAKARRLAEAGIILRAQAAMLEQAGKISGADPLTDISPGDIRELLEVQNVWLRDCPVLPEIQLCRAQLLHLLGCHDEARHWLQNLLQIDPQYAEARLQWGLDLPGSCSLGTAIRELDKALRLDPQRAATDYRLGLICCNPRELQLTISSVQKPITGWHFEYRIACAVQRMHLHGPGNENDAFQPAGPWSWRPGHIRPPRQSFGLEPAACN